MRETDAGAMMRERHSRGSTSDNQNDFNVGADHFRASSRAIRAENTAYHSVMPKLWSRATSNWRLLTNPEGRNQAD